MLKDVKLREDNILVDSEGCSLICPLSFSTESPAKPCVGNCVWSGTIEKANKAEEVVYTFFTCQGRVVGLLDERAIEKEGEEVEKQSS